MTLATAIRASGTFLAVQHPTLITNAGASGDIAAGSVLLLLVENVNTTATSVSSVSGGGLTWARLVTNLVVNTTDATSQHITMEVWWALATAAIAGAGLTVTVNFGATTSGVFSIQEVSGADKVTPLDSSGTHTNTNTSATVAATPSVTVSTTNADAIAFQFYTISASPTGNASNPVGWSIDPAVGNTASAPQSFLELIHKIFSSAQGASTISWSGTDKRWGLLEFAVQAIVPDTVTVAQTLFAPTQSIVVNRPKPIFLSFNGNETTDNDFTWSQDGTTWTIGSMSDRGIWETAAWDKVNKVFAACATEVNSAAGTTGQFSTSPDGINWTRRNASQAGSWAIMAYGNSRFVCLDNSTGANAQVSTNAGVTWVNHATAESNTWRDMCYSPELGLFCAVASTGTHRVMTSPDGVTWTPHTAAEANQWWSICWSKEKTLFVAVARDGTHRVMTSPDGTTWSTQTAASANFWRRVDWSPSLGLFVAVSSDNAGGGGQVMTSPDGLTWTPRAAAASAAWVGLVWSRTLAKFIATANGSADVMTSTNGTTWTSFASALPSASEVNLITINSNDVGDEAAIAQTLTGFSQAVAVHTVGVSAAIAQTLFAPTQAVAAKEVEKATIAQTLFAPTQAVAAQEVEKAAIAQTLFAPSQEIDVTERMIATIAQELFSITETAADIELEPALIAQTLFGISQSVTGFNSSLDSATIAQTLFAPVQEIDVVESVAASIVQTLFAPVQEIDVIEIEPANIDQTFFGISQEIDADSEGGAVEPDVAIIDQTLFGLMQRYDFGLVQEADAVEIIPTRIAQTFRRRFFVAQIFADIAQTFRRRLVTSTASATITTELRGLSQQIRVRNVALGTHPILPGRSGIDAPRDSRQPPITNAELEMFRTKVYARNIDGLVPPPVIANRNLTTTRHPKSRPVVVPAPRGKPK